MLLLFGCVVVACEVSMRPTILQDQCTEHLAKWPVSQADDAIGAWREKTPRRKDWSFESQNRFLMFSACLPIFGVALLDTVSNLEYCILESIPIHKTQGILMKGTKSLSSVVLKLGQPAGDTWTGSSALKTRTDHGHFCFLIEMTKTCVLLKDFLKDLAIRFTHSIFLCWSSREKYLEVATFGLSIFPCLDGVLWRGENGWIGPDLAGSFFWPWNRNFSDLKRWCCS